MFKFPVAACYTPGEVMKTVLNTSPVIEALPVPFWSWRLSQFRHLNVTTLHTQVSFVSIGNRVSCRSAGLACRLASLSAGIPPQTVPLSGAGRLTLVSLLKHSSFEQHL